MSPAQTIRTELAAEKCEAKRVQSKRTPEHNATKQRDIIPEMVQTAERNSTPKQQKGV